MNDERTFIQEVFRLICKTLHHEAAELFKVNGVATFDEHKIINQMFEAEI